jgi:hypothetical protein
MKYLAGLILILGAGCATPAQEYVQADAAAWARFDVDGRIDSWIDSSALDADEKDSLHQLNVARRARIAHALAELQK